MRLNSDIQLAKTLILPFDIFTVTKEMNNGLASFNLKGPIKIKSVRYTFNDRTKRVDLDLVPGNEKLIPVKETLQFDDIAVFTTYDTAEDYMKSVCIKK